MVVARRLRPIAQGSITLLLATSTIGAALLPGCSKAAKSGLDALPRSRAAKRPQGPQTMGNLLLDSYIEDLGSGQLDARLRAARELGNMGADAKKALPALEKMAGDNNAKVRDAAKEAIAAIRRR
jgi:HEAT repeat protein